jgi:xylulokinase
MYWGTSGWVSVATTKFLAHIPSSTTGLLSMQPGIYNLMGQMEITGKTLDRALSILGLTYGDLSGLYDLTPAGANGVLCTPWIGGERTPFSDVTSRGCVTGIGISTTTDDIVRAVVEGICLEYLWELRIIERMVTCDEPVVFLGGGSVNRDICQILSDVLGRVVLAHPDGRFCGNLGIARLAFEFIRGDKIVSSVDQSGLAQYTPHDEYRKLYDGLLEKLKKLRKVK